MLELFGARIAVRRREWFDNYDFLFKENFLFLTISTMIRVAGSLLAARPPCAKHEVDHA
ncbi:MULTISPECIES: hypothetical protein [unclassified Pigmentiphaga]|uniref:hypothetical protein n=1 Tax=unclassified Pigmentiphaga TaxID=2626614 RepID=UPI001303A034|nr:MULTISPECIES: hypothetical protein [unclassified Pigmentiphaga]MBX6318759.1 hypothetical protein [Pigmentiphaga sp.]